MSALLTIKALVPLALLAAIFPGPRHAWAVKIPPPITKAEGVINLCGATTSDSTARFGEIILSETRCYPPQYCNVSAWADYAKPFGGLEPDDTPVVNSAIGGDLWLDGSARSSAKLEYYFAIGTKPGMNIPLDIAGKISGESFTATIHYKIKADIQGFIVSPSFPLPGGHAQTTMMISWGVYDRFYPGVWKIGDNINSEEILWHTLPGPVGEPWSSTLDIPDGAATKAMRYGLIYGIYLHSSCESSGGFWDVGSVIDPTIEIYHPEKVEIDGKMYYLHELVQVNYAKPGLPPLTLLLEE